MLRKLNHMLHHCPDVECASQHCVGNGSKENTLQMSVGLSEVFFLISVKGVKKRVLCAPFRLSCQGEKCVSVLPWIIFVKKKKKKSVFCTWELLDG